MDAAPYIPPPAGPTAGAGICPKAGIAAAAAKVVSKRKSRRCPHMLHILPSFSLFRRLSDYGYTSLARLEGRLTTRPQPEGRDRVRLLRYTDLVRAGRQRDRRSRF
jgi:hypothetical protein